MENLANIKYILNKFDRFITSSTRKETDEDIALYEHWIDCKHDVEEKIKQISDLEEQGLLLRLPCHIGDIIYSVVEDGLEIIELKFSLDFYVRRKDDFGKTVFLTQAEAEQKLNEMEGRHGITE